jgi:hypothetical protein
MSVSGYILEPIREDDEFVLYRGRGQGTRTDKPVVLVLKPAAARPRLQSLNKLKHEYSLIAVCSTRATVAKLEPRQNCEADAGEHWL